ncbi:MDR family MFS transporter [Actinoplanes solisilvae]|uniref:MDR family MFS transporter n=1 Tax=Actinoplanes solisilvae TaxID=2486853 RepID=UPI000FD9D6FD|nr:MDR family MFS transporter [Actinoplanes solisilvae]
MSAATTAAPSGLTHRQVLQVLAGLMLGLFLASLDQTIVASAIRTIGDDLHGLSAQAWVTTAYLITSTISTPLYGKLSDIYGRKKFFLAAIAIFVVGSAASSFADSMYQLAAFRAFQGLGAGGLFSLALAIIGDIVPPRERARYQGYFLAVFGTSSVIGPVIGGFFAGADSILGITGWRWVFLVNVPIGIVALIVVARVLRVDQVRRNHRIDWWGAAWLCVGLVPLLIVAEQGRVWGWGSPRVLGALALGIIGLILFVWAERRLGEEALIPLRFFRNRTFSLTATGGFIVGLAMFGGLALLPLYLQIVRGATPTESGLQLLPLTAGLMAGSIFAGQLISRTGRYKIFPVLGAALAAVGLFLIHMVGVDTPFWRTGIFMAVLGLGLGLILQPITLAVQNAMSPREIGVATSSATFFRQMGATAGTALFLSLLFATVSGNIASQLRNAGPAFQQAISNPAIANDPANAPVIEALRTGQMETADLNDTSFLEKLNPILAHPFKAGFSDSMDMIFLIAAGVMVLGLIIFLFLPEVPLRTKAGAEALEEEEHAAPGAQEALKQGVAAVSPNPEAAVPDEPAPASTPNTDGAGRHRREP